MTEASKIDEVAEFHRWLSEVTDETRVRFGPADRLGTANYIDTAARLRAAGSIKTGEAVSLARPLVEGPGFHVETTFDATGTFGLDRIDSTCHGYRKTHMDALNHLASNGDFYGGRSVADAPPTIVDLAGRCLFTRALFADIPAVRGTAWVSENEPVTGADIDGALSGVDIQPGDALVLYMGRDRWEAEGNTLGHEPGHERGHGAGVSAMKPGAGRGAARWIVEHQISMVAWDFLDAVDDPDAGSEARGSVHRLLPAAGLVLIDNCEMSSAAPLMSRLGRRTAAIAALPLAVPDGTGSIITPWLVL
ncbi:MAG TPA: cyclase family protein [Amycolatopsis sp.]|uniref:cyclase family protein n=1 Tax=Amycolatopsis sp. TaxID=37632 RepID=UPI002B4647FA|nr:cyclase family protein [Amycolatopsis sp.]HKS46988.1 cyclase family protein [Amycolatopsis sp.]